MKTGHDYYVYILTNKAKKVLYVGVTSSLQRRISEHEKGLIRGFTQKYNIKYLVYFEWFDDIEIAIRIEKEIKGWTRRKNEELVSKMNPSWSFLNDQLPV